MADHDAQADLLTGDLSGARVVVMGLGRFGGGVGATRFLVERGCDVLVTDLSDAEALADSLASLQPMIDAGQVQLRLGEHNVSDFTTADLVVANPAVSPHHNRFLRAASAGAVPVTTEVGLLVAKLPARDRVIGITGSAGKSTVTAMVGHALARLQSSPVHLGGNIGGSLLSKLDAITSNDWIVLELSSFQLHYLDKRAWSPHIAAVTNLSPNHLDWHGDMADYTRCKQAIFDHQRDTNGEGDGDIAILGPGADRNLHPRIDPARVLQVRNDAQPVALLLPGSHNQINAQLAATIVSSALHIPTGEGLESLADFPGLPHRLEPIAHALGMADVRCFNDSKSTTPESAILALESFAPGTAHVILGGYDKGADMTSLAQAAASGAAYTYTIGAVGSVISKLIREHGCDRVDDCQTLDAAVAAARGRVKHGQVLLLSPGCASWDQFTDFQQRGERFAALVARPAGESQ